MSNNILGESPVEFKKKIRRFICLSVLGFVAVVLCNVVLTAFRHTIGKPLSMVVNIALDTLYLAILIYYYDHKLSEKIKICKILRLKEESLHGVVEFVEERSIRHRGLDCYEVSISSRKLFLPISCSACLKKGEIVSVKHVQRIITEVLK
jgi:hypothetical protein